jgi:hypothetical protein
MTSEAERRKLQIATLQDHVIMVERSAAALRHSLLKCEAIGIKPDYSLDELDRFEALTSRFARTADLYTQRLLKSLFIVLGESAGSFLDKARLAEKLGIVGNAEDLVAIRDLRNTIAHEYAATDLGEIFRRALDLGGRLVQLIEAGVRYARVNEGLATPPRG